MTRRKNDLWDIGGDFYNGLWEDNTKKRYTKKRKNYRKNNAYEKIDPLAGIIGLFVLFSYMTYTKYILPNIEKIKFYSIVFLIIVGIILAGYLIYIVKKRISNKRIEAKKIANIPNFLLELDKKIKEFKPIRQYKEERLYQTELVGFLKNNYPNLKIEETKDYSRPDIIIDNIAIEIKGPTNMSGLKTIPDKINSYLPKWDYLFIVLFNIQIGENKEKSKIIYKNKKQEILENIVEYKRDKVFFIEID